MKRRAEMMAHRPRNEHGPWRAHRLGYVTRNSDRNRRHTLGFDLALDQSHGLMTDGSSRTQQRGIGVFRRNHLVRDILRDRRFKSARIHVVTNEAEEISG